MWRAWITVEVQGLFEEQEPDHGKFWVLGWEAEFFLWVEEKHLEIFRPRNVDLCNPKLREDWKEKTAAEETDAETIVGLICEMSGVEHVGWW